MTRFFKKEDILLGSPQETMGISKDNYFYQVSTIQKYMIKKYDLSSLNQIEDIKNHLLAKNILIINAKELLERNKERIEILKESIEGLKSFVKEKGGSIGRIGDQYLLLTPNASVKIAN